MLEITSSSIPSCKVSPYESKQLRSASKGRFGKKLQLTKEQMLLHEVTK